MKNEQTKALKIVPREKAFYFFTSMGNYTGESASSLKEFMEKISTVNVKSIEFHLYRGDFERWVAEVLEDRELAEKICKLRQLNYSGNTLRENLYNIVAKRFKELSGLS
ncbi:MAG: DUF5752 family protein [Candidatus Bathyarchaeia archaeon]|nr:hypothetical protein [Candidatus Bathyarchaeota archaeon]